MTNIFSKLRDFVGLNDPAEYDYEYEEDGDGYNKNGYQQEQPQPTPEEVPSQRRRARERVAVATDAGMGPTMSNVIGMPGANSVAEVVVMEPRSFEEMPQAIQALRDRKTVVLNLTMMDPDQAQRAVDFVAGGTFAMDGHQERVGESIFLFTPICVQVTTQSGVTHEVTQNHVRIQRNTAPAPAWTPEATRIVQSS